MVVIPTSRFQKTTIIQRWCKRYHQSPGGECDTRHTMGVLQFVLQITFQTTSRVRHRRCHLKETFAGLI
jgi:hypothetical protein